jgi:beta-lactam-binding protein with PASTA domain
VNGTEVPGSRWRRLPREVRGAIVFALGVGAAIVLFNAVVMPRFVGHGRDVPVPDLRGKTIADAALLLTRSRLAVRDTVDRIDPAPPGTVIGSTRIRSPGATSSPTGGSGSW